MKTIFKIAFDVTDYFTIPVPDGAAIVHVDAQAGIPTMWVHVDTSAPVVERNFAVVGTGQRVAPSWTYIETFQMPPFVWHLFEVYQ
jgi:hypothetical protein